ncbi:hypothetical protein ORL59_27720 [Bacillus cereus]|uniref:hypothetical protein n=1 Tax=Bacillus cereus TaxID=1396 RepID=UPI002AC1E694|nr:hypothetical protein [Bacillus cereus]MDZ4417306.1 hypothetical protein [Bacillus cereus]
MTLVYMSWYDCNVLLAGTNYGWEPNKMITRAEAAQLTAKSDIISNDKKNKLKKVI